MQVSNLRFPKSLVYGVALAGLLVLGPATTKGHAFIAWIAVVSVFLVSIVIGAARGNRFDGRALVRLYATAVSLVFLAILTTSVIYGGNVTDTALLLDRRSSGGGLALLSAYSLFSVVCGVHLGSLIRRVYTYTTHRVRRGVK